MVLLCNPAQIQNHYIIERSKPKSGVCQKAVYALILSNTLNRQPKTPKPVINWKKDFGFNIFMGFFSSTVDTMSVAIIAVGAGLAVWGGINLLEGYGNDNRATRS